MTEETPHIGPKRFRALAPAGGFPSPLATFNAWRSLRQLARGARACDPRHSFREALKERFHVNHAELYGSGTEALYRVFCSIQTSTGPRTIAMAAYTCPSIASAAVRAGFRIAVVDIDDKTLEMDPATVDANQICAVVCSNLYGLVDDIRCWQDTAQTGNIVVIDDACQGGLSAVSGTRVGARTGTIGVLSFGRGKAINGIGGGAVIYNNELLMGSRENWVGTESDFVARLRDSSMAAVASSLEHPLLYGIPARLPFLKLGQTHCEIDFLLQPISNVQLSVAFAQLSREVETIQIATDKMSQWEKALINENLVQPFIERKRNTSATIVPIRYPILFRNKQQRDRVWIKLAEAGLGASISYPKPLEGYDALREHIQPNSALRACQVADRILTLPVHRHVQRGDIEQAAAIIRRENQ